MLSRRLKLVVPVALSLLLAACGQEAEKKSAKTLYLEGYQQLSAPSAQYNFNADIKLDGHQLEPMLADVKLTLKGAADIERKKFEIIPEVKAAMFQITLPLSLDLKQQHLMLDPSDIISAMQMFQPGASGVVERYKNKYVRLQKASFKLDEEQQQEVDSALGVAGEVLDIVFDVAEKVSQDLPESSFQLQELGDSGKHAGAVTAVTLTLTAEQRKKLEDDMYIQVRQRITESDSIPDEIKENIIVAMEEAKAAEQVQENTDSIIYLNDKGQIVRINDRYAYTVEGKQALVDLHVVLSNYGQAQFVITPPEERIIDLDEEEIAIIQFLMGK